MKLKNAINAAYVALFFLFFIVTIFVCAFPEIVLELLN